MKLLDRLLGRTGKKTAPAPQLSSIDVASPSTLTVGSEKIVGGTLHLTAATATDTVVTAAGSDASVLAVSDVTVPAGESSAPIIVSVLEPSAGVTVGFTLGTQTLTATFVPSAPA